MSGITFFSAGFEGAMIVVAAIWILVETVEKWIGGLPLEHLGSGVLLLLGAGLLNAWLGWYLLRGGKRSYSLILEADGKHVLTDSYTSFGVVAGLGLVTLTGWKPFDPLVAIAIAVNILWSGGRLAWRSVVGLLDYSDPDTRASESVNGSMPLRMSLGCILTVSAIARRDTARSSKCISCFRTKPQ